MLAFKIGDQFADLDEKMKLSFTMLNPVFDKEGLQRTFSYSVKFPVTPQNNSIFRHNYRMDAKGQRQYDMTSFLQHLPFEKGVFILQNTNEQFYSGVFSNETITVAKTYKEKRLRELQMIETIPVGDTPTITLKAQTLIGLVPFVQININNQRFISHIEASPGIVGLINEVFPGCAQLVSLTNNGPFPADPAYTDIELIITLSWPDPHTPLWLDNTKDLSRYVSLFVTSTPFDITSDIIADAWTAKLAEITTAPTTHCFPCVRNDEFYDDKNPGYVGYVNYVNSVAGNYLTFGTYGETVQWQSMLVPYVFVKEILRVIAELSGHTPTGDFYLHDLMNELIVHSNISIEENWYQKISTGTGLYTTDAYHHTAKPKYNLAEVLPDIQVFDFLQYLRSNFFLYFNVENGQLYINTIKSQLVAAVEDWTNKVAPEYSKKISNKATLEVKHKYDRTEDPEHLYNNQLTNLTIEGNNNVPSDKWELDFFSLFSNIQFNIESFPPYERDWLVPQITEQGTSAPMGMNNETQPRLLLYKGWKRDSLAYNYPLATSQDRDTEGNIIGAYTLNIDGPKGVYNQFGKEYLRLINQGDTIEIGVRLTIADILNIRRWKSVRKYITHPKGTFVGIIKSVRFTATMEGIETASVEFVRQT